MKSSISKKLAGRSFLALLIIALVTVTAFGQDFVVTGAPTLNGSGTYNIRGNITNTVPISITPTVTMEGTAAQSIGTTGAITLTNLNVNTNGGTSTTTMNVAVDVNTALSVAATSTLAVAANQLNISGTSTLNTTGILSTVAGSTVVYDAAGAGQSVLGGFAYTGNLTLSGGTKTFNAGTLTSVGVAFDASGAGLVTLSGTALTLGTTSTFAALTNSATINNGSGLTQFGAVTNTGTINGTVGAGALTFNSTVGNNGGTITGGAALVTFNGLLTQTATGILTSGAGGLTLTAGLTNTLGNITLASGQSMTIAGGQFTSAAGTLTFPAGSTVIYGSGATTIYDMSYGNLTLNGDAKAWTLGAARTVSGNLTLGASAATTIGGAFDLNVGGNVSLAANLTKSANAVAFANASSAVSGTGYEIVGSVTRTHTFASLAYTFNNAQTTVNPTANPANLTSFTMTAQPSTNPVNYDADHSVNRRYTQTYASTGAFTADIKLAYLSSEAGGSVNQARLRDFQTSITKTNLLSNVPANYTRSSGDGFSTVALSNIASTSLTSGQNLVLDDRFYQFISIASTAWNVGGTWDQGGVIPGASDDVSIINTFAVTIPDGLTAEALSVTIDGTTANSLTVGAGAATTLNVGTGGLTNNATLGALTVSANAIVNITGGNLTTGGSITNNGTVNVQ